MSTVSIPNRLVVGPADHGRAFTPDAYFHLEVEPGYRCELARGVLEVTFIPAEAHALLVCYFYDLLSVYRRAHPGVIFLYGGSNEFHFWLSEQLSGRNPDVGVSLHGAASDHLGHRIAALAIEVVSPGKEAHHRDYVAKREDYLLYGLQEYWIVDRFARTVMVLIREDESWSERIFLKDEIAQGLILPGFAVSVADLWAVIEDAHDFTPEAEA